MPPADRLQHGFERGRVLLAVGLAQIKYVAASHNRVHEFDDIGLRLARSPEAQVHEIKVQLATENCLIGLPRTG